VLAQQAFSETSTKADLVKKSDTSNMSKISNKEFEAKIAKQFSINKEWKKVNSTSAFETWIKDKDYQIVNGKKIWNKAIFKIDPTKNYDKARSDKNTVVIYPTFTDSA
jgi:dTDP-4-dehydrorhamnose reductase